MLHKAEEWTLIRHAPKLKLMKEYGRSLGLDDEAEKKLLAAAAACKWRQPRQVLAKMVRAEGIEPSTY